MNESAKIFQLYVEAQMPVDFQGDQVDPGPETPPNVPIETVPAHGEADMANPEERREVEIGNELLKQFQYLEGSVLKGRELEELKKLANELLTMHKQKPTVADAQEAEETLAAVES